MDSRFGNTISSYSTNTSNIAKAAGIKKFRILLDEQPDDDFTEAMVSVSADTGVKGVKAAAKQIKEKVQAPTGGLMGQPEEKK